MIFVGNSNNDNLNILKELENLKKESSPEKQINGKWSYRWFWFSIMFSSFVYCEK